MQARLYRDHRVIIILGLSWDNGKCNGNYKEYRVYRDYRVIVILGLFWENDKENGSYFLGSKTLCPNAKRYPNKCIDARGWILHILCSIFRWKAEFTGAVKPKENPLQFQGALYRYYAVV